MSYNPWAPGGMFVPQMPQMQQPQTAGYQGMPQAQPSQPSLGNKIYVTSLDDAFSRPIANNSIMNYVLQDESKLFEIYSDNYGRKGYKVFNLTPYDEKKEEQKYVPLDEFERFKAEFRAKFPEQTKEETKS